MFEAEYVSTTTDLFIGTRYFGVLLLLLYRLFLLVFFGYEHRRYTCQYRSSIGKTT